MTPKRIAVIVLAALVVGGVVAAVATGERGPRDAAELLPGSMAAIGDSISRAAALGPESPGDSPERSWATGTASYSHRSRLIAAGATLEADDVHNLAVSGARMRDAPAQARAAVEAEVDYVTFLMGANDVCAPDMTPVPDFEGGFLASLNILMSRLPNVQVFVASIPDIHHLRVLFEDDPSAGARWEAVGVCPSLLSPGLSEQARSDARERLGAYNLVLEEGCSAVARCTFDGGAVFAHRFDAGDVSPLDRFHPSRAGQETLAEITWPATPWVAQR